MNIKKLFAAKCAVLTLLLIASGFTSTNFANQAPQKNQSFTFSSSVTNIDEAENEIFDLVNKERRRNNLGELEWNDGLAKLARDYSIKMAHGRFFDHSDPDGATVVERAKDARIKNWSKIGENLFYCQGIYDFSFFAVKGWMKSPTHKDNILDGDWTDSGIGIAQSRSGQIYITQVFIER